MDASHWNEVEEIYCAALGSPPEQRPALLRERCGDDAQLMREVESLLQADANAGSFLGPAELELHVKNLAQESEPTAAGTTYGHYEIVSRLATGGMGEVYLAVDQRLNRKIALKVLPSEFTQDLRRVRRLLREAKAASSLNHPNIITVYEIGTFGESHFIASEFIEGETLRQLLKAGISPNHAIHIALQCANALDAAHKSGITHRDVKPENIMVRPDGLVKVLDFGLALRVDDLGERPPGASVQTESGAVMGTPRYMSPEQARGQRLDRRTDIFSLGAVLYEMTAGEPPFPGATTAEVFAQLLGSEPKPLSEFRRNLPAKLQAILTTSMAKDREKRYQTMSALIADLTMVEAVLENETIPSPEELVQEPADSAPPAKAKPGRKRLHTAMAAAGIAAVAILLFAGRWGARPRPASVSPSVVPLTSFGGDKNHAALAPDGSQVAFAWDGGKPGKRDIYVKVVGAGEPLRITSSAQGDWLPAWSPDGRFIAFSRNTSSGQAVYMVPALGGEERKVADAGIGLSWLPDSRSLVLASPLPPLDTGGLVVVSLDSGDRRPLTTPQPYADSLPAVSPDGARVAFVRTLTRSARELFVVPARGGPVQQITFAGRPVYGATWTPDSRYLIFSCNRGAGENLWRVAATGGTPEPILVGLRSAFYPNMARTGNRLVYTEEYQDTNVYRYTGPGLKAGLTPGKFGAPGGLIVSSREDAAPAFSPDGRRIAFVSKRTGNEEIWLCDRNGGHLVQLTTSSGTATGTPRWSPDGNWIAFDSREAGSPDIYVIAAEGGVSRRVTTDPSADTVPSWSHDGKWLYFISNRSGADEVWRMPSAGGGAVQLTHTGARDALEGPGGERVYFVKSGAWGIWSVKTDGSYEAVVPGLEHAGRTRLWGIHNNGIYFVSKDSSSRHNVEWYSFATRKIQVLLTFSKDPFWNGPGLALSPDAKELLLVSLDQHVDDLMLIEGIR